MCDVELQAVKGGDAVVDVDPEYTMPIDYAEEVEEAFRLFDADEDSNAMPHRRKKKNLERQACLCLQLPLYLCVSFRCR